MKWSDIPQIARELQLDLNEGTEKSLFSFQDPRIIVKLFETDKAGTVRLWVKNIGSGIMLKKNITFKSDVDLVKQTVELIEADPFIRSEPQKKAILEYAELRGVHLIDVAVRKYGFGIKTESNDVYVHDIERAYRLIDNHGVL